MAGGINPFLYSLNNPINLIDPLGLEARDILPGIRKALIGGATRGAYAVGEAAKATFDIALHGPPLAKVSIGVAAVSEVVPLLGAAAISAYPTVTSIVLQSAPYSREIVAFTYGWFTVTGPPQGWGYLSGGVKYTYEKIKDILTENYSTGCEER